MLSITTTFCVRIKYMFVWELYFYKLSYYRNLRFQLNTKQIKDSNFSQSCTHFSRQRWQIMWQTNLKTVVQYSTVWSYLDKSQHSVNCRHKCCARGPLHLYFKIALLFPQLGILLVSHMHTLRNKTALWKIGKNGHKSWSITSINLALSFRWTV